MNNEQQPLYDTEILNCTKARMVAPPWKQWSQECSKTLEMTERIKARIAECHVCDYSEVMKLNASLETLVLKHGDFLKELSSELKL